MPSQLLRIDRTVVDEPRLLAVQFTRASNDSYSAKLWIDQGSAAPITHELPPGKDAANLCFQLRKSEGWVCPRLLAVRLAAVRLVTFSGNEHDVTGAVVHVGGGSGGPWAEITVTDVAEAANLDHLLNPLAPRVPAAR